MEIRILDRIDGVPVCGIKYVNGEGLGNIIFNGGVSGVGVNFKSSPVPFLYNKEIKDGNIDHKIKSVSGYNLNLDGEKISKKEYDILVNKYSKILS